MLIETKQTSPLSSTPDAIENAYFHPAGYMVYKNWTPRDFHL